MITNNDRLVAELDTELSRSTVEAPAPTTFSYEYNIKDHLGNTRVTVQDSAGVTVVQQENHYDPFGYTLTGQAYNNPLQLAVNKYQYNGKELQDDFGLDWYDYGARFYDAQLGRFNVVDRFAEKYFSYNPYQYCLNNPLRFIDINGDSVRTTKAFENDAQIFKAYNRWLKTNSGVEFMKLFGEGGKFEHIAVVFDAIDPYKLSRNGISGESGMEYVDSEDKVTKLGNSPASKEVKDAANGKSENSFLRSTINIGLYDYPNNFDVAQIAKTYMHESQHTILDAETLKTGQKSTYGAQHTLMLNKSDQYYKTRYNSYWQLRDLWAPEYKNQRTEYKQDVVKFVDDQVNNFW